MPARPVLIVSASGRALAASAVRAGIPVVVLDLFDDVDTRALAVASRCCAGAAGGFSQRLLLAAARELSPPEGFAAAVVGSGLEARPRTWSALARQAPLLGNSMESIALSKDPVRFFALLDRLGIAHPEVRLDVPEDRRGWLSKRIGGAGGVHVRPAEAPWSQRERRYFQRYVPGEVLSALFLADGRQALRVGLNRLRAEALSPSKPFAYGGAVTLSGIAPSELAQIDRAIAMLTEALGLRGLNGIDFVRSREGVVILELNARPTATMELSDDRVAGGLFRAHLAACAGALPDHLQPPARSHAHAVLWARAPLHIEARTHWPTWVSDIPTPGTSVRARRPVCTVHACADDADAAERLAKNRMEALRAELEGARA